MRLLLDTHAFAWWILADSRMPERVRAMIEGAEEVQVSIATAWEMAIKVGAGKWPDAVRLLEAFDVAVAEEGFQLLPIALPHVRRAGLMISANRDPFDRLLVAQALTEGLVLVSSDPRMGEMGANLVC